LVQPLYLKNDRANCGFSFETPNGLLNVFSADAEETLIVFEVFAFYFLKSARFLGYEEKKTKEE